MLLPKLLAGAAVALALPTAAQAAPPWSDPVPVPGSQSQAGGAPRVLFTRTRGGAIAFNAPGSFPGSATLRSVLGDGGPLAATRWDGAQDFDTTSGALAAGDRILYAGSNGRGRVNVAMAAGPESPWRVELRGPRTGGARSAPAAVAHGRGAVAFSTFGRGDIGAVYLVRQTGTAKLGPTQRVSARGHIRAVAVAVDATGDALVAWDRHGTIEARMWIGRSRRLTAVQALGTVTAAAHLSVALGADRRAIVAWVDQRVSEGDTNVKARVMAAVRSGSRPFRLRELEAYPDTTIPGGTGVEAVYTSDGRGVIAWSGRDAARAALVHGRAIGVAQDLAPIVQDGMHPDAGLGDLATAPSGDAAVTLLAPVDATRNQVLAAALAHGAPAFGATEAVSPPAPFLGRPSAGYETGSGGLLVAWRLPAEAPDPSRIEFSQRPAP